MRTIFVLGTGRCGSTLLHEVMAKHPSFGFISNVDDRVPGDMAGRWNNTLYRRIPPAMTRKGRLRYAPSEGYTILDRVVSPILSRPFRDLTAEDVTPWLRGRFHDFFEKRARAQGKEVMLHKFTGWPRAGFIQEVFPDALFINVVRDGRAVANSFLQMPWWLGYRGPSEWSWGPLPAAYEEEWESSGRSFVLLAGLEWKLLIDAFEVAREKVPSDRWLDIRYEDFVSDPRSTVQQVLGFCRIENSATFEKEFSRFSFSTGRSEAFRQQLSPAQLEMLSTSLSQHLERYGYG